VEGFYAHVRKCDGRLQEDGNAYVVTVELLKTIAVTVVGAAVKVFCFLVSLLLHHMRKEHLRFGSQ
jgi:hypothetical protein